ncbi:putative tRNA (adenine(37)-N6)-methyltransferase [Novipirellula aureliae]|uniref:Putative tRNA (Adenine(37)-N6)-methyltransferase n=1 Tax=Novipirellula aureliae TaxID=2527966 RepID=A0A5C6EAF5_9BACT|nr:tRNA (N6-threonylcarbamoyladenosine(37)-N6)-methyltransferase TrmO [Novipirellula aureliae]TWU44139.1 putative tRNA (adenine(37)-N6)-methyltransferase [Novipirellula aureliae]
MKPFNLILAVSIAALAFTSSKTIAEEPPEMPSPSFAVHPIGHFKNTDGQTRIVIDKKFQAGLLGLDGYSHIQVFWWFSNNDTPEKRAILQVHPRGNKDNPLTGVFATRSPFRPNLIALTLCKIVSIKDNVIEIEKTDAFDGTPILDIKPFVPGYDSVEDAKVAERLGKTGG